MKVLYPKLYSMVHLLALNVLLLPKDLTIIFIVMGKVKICYFYSLIFIYREMFNE